LLGTVAAVVLGAFVWKNITKFQLILGSALFLAVAVRLSVWVCLGVGLGTLRDRLVPIFAFNIVYRLASVLFGALLLVFGIGLRW
jgi:hypothetical protein